MKFGSYAHLNMQMSTIKFFGISGHFVEKSLIKVIRKNLLYG